MGLPSRFGFVDAIVRLIAVEIDMDQTLGGEILARAARLT